MKIFTTSRDDYLKAIYVLSKEMQEVRSVDLAEYLHFTKASISRAVSLLCNEGYLLVKDHGLHLTNKGLKIAEVTYNKYCFFSEQLIDLGVAPQTAYEDACRLEHAISDESFHKLQMAMIFPKSTTAV